MTSLFSTNEAVSLERDVDMSAELPIEQIWTPTELQRCIEFIDSGGFERVCLQFSDDLLTFSTHITREISTKVKAKVFILGDTSYGSCCVDEIAASHATADALIHFGRACLSKVTRIPVLYVFYKFPLDVQKFIKVLKGLSTDDEKILFYDTGYHYLIPEIRSQLSSEIEVADLALETEPEVLCWSNHVKDIEDSVCLYLGPDNQTFFNLTMALKTKQWMLYTDDKFVEATPFDSRWMRRRYFYIEKCKDAKSLGIVVGTLTTKGYLDMVTHIQSLAKLRSIRTYIISVGKVNPAKLANFNDIDAFVLVGCPENTLYTSRDFYKPLVSVFEVEMALNPAWQSQIPETYCTDFAQLLPNGSLYREPNGKFDSNDVSLVSGKARNLNATEDKGDGTQAVERVKNELSETTEAFNQRSFRGLDPQLGRDAPVVITKGRQGIPIRYSENPTSD